MTMLARFIRSVMPIILLLQVIPSAHSRDPWITQTGLTLEQLNSRKEVFLKSKAGVIPMQVSGYDDHGAALYSVLWGPATDGAPRRIVAGLDSRSLQLLNDRYQIDGWRLTWLNGYHFNGGDYYNAIYSEGTGAKQVLRLGDSLFSFEAADDQNRNSGHYLENFCSFRSSAGVIRYGGFWNTSGRSGPEIRRYMGQTTAQLEALVATNAAAWRIHNLCGYHTAGGEARYDLLLRAPALPGFLYHVAMNSLNFHAQNGNYIGIGWRPAFLQMWSATPTDVRCSALWVPNEGLDYSYIDQLNNVVTTGMSENKIPALSLAITHDGRLIFRRAWGWADIASNRWAGPDHRFRLASVSKAFTGLAAVRALQDAPGGTTINTPVFGTGALFGNDFGTPPYSTRERAVTIRHLLQHVAGWPNDGKLWYHDETSWGSDNRPAISWQLDNVAQTSDPGTMGRYSNLGYTMAARTVEYMSGQSFENYVTNTIIAPCGYSGIYRPVIGDRTQAQRKFEEVVYYSGPNYGDGGTFDPYLIDPRRMDGSTGWIARPSDLLLISRRVDGDPLHADIITPASLAALRTSGPGVPSSGYNSSNYGLGWYSESGYWGHNGSMSGTRAEWMTGTNGNSFAWVTNTRAGIANSDIRTVINSIESADAWPDLDLFGIYHPYYQDWLSKHFAPIEWLEPGLQEVLWGPHADPDGDHLTNEMECYLGLDPRSSNRSPFISEVVADKVVGGHNLRIRWYRAADVEGITIGCQKSNDLLTWKVGSGEIADVTGVFNPVGFRLQQLLVPLTKAGLYVRFFCVTH